MRMEKTREFLEKTTGEPNPQLVSRLTFPPHRPHLQSSFYEYFILRGIHVDRVEEGLIFCSFKVPARLTDSDEYLATGVIASIVDEIGAAAVHEEGRPMDVSVDMSISYISSAKMNDELEIISRCLGKKGSYASTNVLIRNKAMGEVVAEGRHSLFSKPSSKM